MLTLFEDKMCDCKKCKVHCARTQKNVKLSLQTTHQLVLLTMSAGLFHFKEISVPVCVVNKVTLGLSSSVVSTSANMPDSYQFFI